MTDDTPYYDVIRQLFKVIKPSIEYDFESVELYNETGYPLVTIPAYYLYPIKFWLLRGEDLLYVIPKMLLPPAKSPNNNNNNTKHSITIRTINEEVKLTIEISTEENAIELTGMEMKLAIAHHIHIPPHCIFLWYKLPNHRFQNQLEDGKSLDMISIVEKKTIIIFDLSEEYWAPTSLDFYASGITQPCGMRHNEIQVLNTFNAELMYFTKVLASRTKDDQFLFLGSLRKNSCSPPLVYAFFLLAQGYFISLPHKIAVLEGVSMVLSFAVKNKNSILDKFSLFSKFCAYIESTATQGDRNTEQYESLYLPARTRRKSHDENIRRLSMSFPDEQKEMLLWSSVRRVNQKFNTKIVLDDSINFPYKHPVELMFDFMYNRIDNGLMVSQTGGSEEAVVFTGRSNKSYKYLKYYAPSEGKAVTFHPHDFVTTPATISEESSHNSSLNSIILLLDISQEMCRTDIHFSQNSKHKIRTDKSGITQISASFILITALIDRLIRQDSNYLLGLYIFSNDRSEDEFNRLIVAPTLSYNDTANAINTTLQVLTRPTVAKQSRPVENPLTKGIEFCNANYHTSTLICLTNESFTKEEFTNATTINTLVMFGGRCNSEKFEKNKVGMILNENSIDRHISNEQSRYTSYPFTDSRLVEYIDLIENHIRIDNNIESVMKSPNFKEFNDYEDQIQLSGNKYTSTSTPDDVLAILKEVTLYMHNPNPYAKMYSNGSLKDWSITFDFNNVIPNVELLMHLPTRYPLVAPKFRLLCRIRHCNVDKRGYLCHPILFEDYKLGVSLRKVIDSIYNLLVSPLASHAVQTKETILFYSNPTEKKVPILSSSFVSSKVKLRRSQSAKTVRKNKPTCPDYLICPLTSRLFENPVITPDGHTYDKDAILLYINLNHKDPTSGSQLSEEDLTANKSISDGVAKYKRGVSIEKYWWEQKI